MSTADAIDAPADARELVLDRLIDAPRDVLYSLWVDPSRMPEWFCPKPWRVTDAQVDPRAGGIFKFVMEGPNGERFDEPAGVFLEVIPGRKLVWTDAIGPGWVPTGKAFMVVEVTFTDEGGKTRYVATARHWSAEDRAKHEQMGFHQGWGIVADQLEALAKSM